MLRYPNNCVPLCGIITSDMPRQARKTSGTGIYHVMLRGINRQDIFESPNDYFLFIGIMGMVLLIHLTELFGGIMFVSTYNRTHK
jgi:hypothetical protein